MYGILQIALGASCMNRASVFELHKRFKEGRVMLELWGMRSTPLPSLQGLLWPRVVAPDRALLNGSNTSKLCTYAKLN